MQLLGLLVAFAAILILVGRRVNIGICLAVGTVILAVGSLMPPGDFALSVLRSLTRAQSIELILGVAMITSLAGVLRHFGLLDRMVRSVTVLLGGVRLAAAAVPSLIGTMPVYGGAVFSAPMVDGLGDQIGLSPVRKTAVNLVFRHAWFFVAPFSTALMLASKLAQVPLGQLILRQVPMALAMLVVGYLWLLGRARTAPPAPAVEDTPAPAPPSDVTATSDVAATSDGPATPHGAGPHTQAQALWPFLRSASPLIVGVALSLNPGGLDLPLYVSVGLGVALALVLSWRHPGFRSLGLPVAFKCIQWKIVLTMAAVMVFGGMIKDSGTSQAVVDALVSSGLPPWVLLTALPLIIAYVSGTPEAAIGVAFPVLMPLAAPGHVLATASALYCCQFCAYFTSPLHLCQALTTQFFGVTVPRLYREYWPVLAALVALTAVYVFLAVN